MTEALQALFSRHPIAEAMSELVPQSRRDGEILDLATGAAAGRSAELQAAIWLYVDELDRSHALSQSIDTATGSYWHGIMHRREGDFSNAKYWFRRVGEHPVISEVDYEPYAFIDECSRRYRDNPSELVELQRREWLTLFNWCLRENELQRPE